MKTFRSLSVRSLAVFVLFALAVLSGTSPRASAQETVQGTMNLPVAAKLGSTLLPPGQYKFTVALLGDTRSISDIAVPKHVYVLLAGTSKDAPVASALAMASPIDAHLPLPANFVPAGDALMINAIPLPEFGIVIQFFGASGKEAVHANATQPSAGVISAKADYPKM